MIDVFWNRGNTTIKISPIVSDCSCENSSDSIGSLTFTIDKEKATNLKFEMGDNIIVPYPDDKSKVLFRGKVFKRSNDKNSDLSITAYDILKYFQGSKYYVFPTVDLGSIIKVMCADLEVSYGYLESTPSCPAKLYTDKAYGDILAEYESYLLYMNGIKYVHRVENGEIALRNQADLLTPFTITKSIATEYTSEESAEDVINVVEVTSKNSSTGEYNRYVAGDKDSMDKLGVLVKTESADDDTDWNQLVTQAENKLFINKQYKYSISFTIPKLAFLKMYDIIRLDLGDEREMGYIDKISWDLVSEETQISLVVLGK